MKIITASKHYYQKTGLELYLFKLIYYFKQKGHAIVPFSSKSKHNHFNKYADYFTENITNKNEQNRINSLKEVLLNIDIHKKFSKLLDQTTPDIVFCFDAYNYLSPSLFSETKARNIPVIYRISDLSFLYKITENNFEYKLKDFLTDFLLDKPLIETKNTLYELEENYQFNNVTKIITPTSFLKNSLKSKINPDKKIIHLPFYIDTKDYQPDYKSDAYILYYGNLNDENLNFLLSTISELKHIKLIITGRENQQKLINEIKIRKNLINVKFISSINKKVRHGLIKKARCVVIPSENINEIIPAALESFALGTPVIAAEFPGVTEYLQKGNDSFIYSKNNKQELKQKLEFIINQPKLSEEMGEYARTKVEQNFTPEKHHNILDSIIREITEHKKLSKNKRGTVVDQL